MPQVVIVGDRDSGRTTFLGLLYVAQVQSGSDRADRFRFHSTFESMEEITVLFQRLMSGGFPDSATKEGIREMRVHLGYRGRGRGVLSRLRSRAWSPDSVATFRFILSRTLDDEVSGFLHGSSVANGRLSDILEGDAMAILVDSTKLGVNGEEPPEGAIERYDVAVEAFLTAIQRWRARGGRSRVYPVFVLTKFDGIRPEVLRAAKVDDSPPQADRTAERAKYGEALLGRNLPKTFKKLAPGEKGGLEFARPTYFFSWVRTEAASSGRPGKIRLRRTASFGWEPDYSKEEYVALLEHLWGVGTRTPR